MKKFYVYAIRVDGKIKYIGKGQGDRMKLYTNQGELKWPSAWPVLPSSKQTEINGP
jgi:hypothetical protein